MKLRDYRKSKNLSVNDAAAQNDVSAVTWRWWESGKTIPDKANKKKIYEWSEHQVEPNDFYDFVLRPVFTETANAVS